MLVLQRNIPIMDYTIHYRSISQFSNEPTSETCFYSILCITGFFGTIPDALFIALLFSSHWQESHHLTSEGRYPDHNTRFDQGSIGLSKTTMNK
jgi:hypothetical protein